MFGLQLLAKKEISKSKSDTKVNKNFHLMKKAIDFEPIIEYSNNKLKFKFLKESQEDSIIVKLPKSKDYKDILYLDTAGFLYITNDLKVPEKVFTAECKTGIADLEGNVLLKAIYDKVYVYDQTIKDFVVIESKGLLGLADKKGKIVVNPEYHKIYPDFTNSKYIAILKLHNFYYSLDSNFKISHLKWDFYEIPKITQKINLISEENKYKILGYPLFEIQNPKFQTYNHHYHFLCEDNFKELNNNIAKIDHFRPTSLDEIDFPPYEEIHISPIKKLFNNIYALLLDFFENGDRASKISKTELITFNNILEKIDSKLIYYNYTNSMSKDTFELINLSFEENNDLDITNNIKFSPPIILTSQINANKVLYDSLQDNDEYFLMQDSVKLTNIETINESYFINDFGKIEKISNINIKRKKFLFTAFRQIYEEDLQIADYFLSFPNSERGPELNYREMNEQEIQEILNEIEDSYKDCNCKISKRDSFNISFLKNKLNSKQINKIKE